MQYRHALERPDYSDLSSGRVFHGLPGHPAFPVRLASEIFQRCLAYREERHSHAPCVLYDPCCGAAYHLAVLACLHRERIGAVIASDADENALQAADRNLALLSPAGMDLRMAEISEMFARYGKDSHRAALASAQALKQGLLDKSGERALPTRTFRANALDPQSISKHIQAGSVDVILTDVPYGLHSHWIEPLPDRENPNPLNTLLTGLAGLLSPSGVVAVVSDKGQKASPAGYLRLEQFQAGKRRVTILTPSD